MLWANLNLLFWPSLVPFATGRMRQSHLAAMPTALYGVTLLMSALAWYGLELAIIRSQGDESRWLVQPAATSRARSHRCSISPELCLHLQMLGSQVRSIFWWPCYGSSRIGASKECWAVLETRMSPPLSAKGIEPWPIQTRFSARVRKLGRVHPASRSRASR